MSYDFDNFHIIRDLMELRRHFRNRLKSAVINSIMMHSKVDKKLLMKDMTDYHEQLISFGGKQFPKEIILTAVRCYVAYPLSYRHVEELMAERNVKVDHSAQAMIAGIELHHMLKKGQHQNSDDGTVYEQFYALAG